MEILAGLIFLALPLIAYRVAAVLVTLSRRQRQTLEGVRL
jgi:hypothetical protein